MLELERFPQFLNFTFQNELVSKKHLNQKLDWAGYKNNLNLIWTKCICDAMPTIRKTMLIASN